MGWIEVLLGAGLETPPLTKATQEKIEAAVESGDYTELEDGSKVVRVWSDEKAFVRPEGAVVDIASPTFGDFECLGVENMLSMNPEQTCSTPEPTEEPGTWSATWNHSTAAARWYDGDTPKIKLTTVEGDWEHGDAVLRRLREILHPPSLRKFPRASISDLSKALGERLMIVFGDSITIHILLQLHCLAANQGMLAQMPAPTELYKRSREIVDKGGLGSYDFTIALPDGGLIIRGGGMQHFPDMHYLAFDFADVIVANWALHYAYPARQEVFTDYMEKYIARAYEFAKEDGKVFIWRATSTQHFCRDGGGLFEKCSHKETLCGPLGKFTPDPRDVTVKAIMDRLDPDGKVFYYVDYHAITWDLYNIHFGKAKKGDKDVYDCTHSCFAPSLMEQLIAEIIQGIRTIDNNRLD